MKYLTKIPLYTGIAVFIISIFISVSKVTSNSSLANIQSRATEKGAKLMIKYTEPKYISILLNSENKVGGVDVTIKYNMDKLDILSSTLSGGTLYTVTGGNTDLTNGTFSFSAIPKSETVKSGIVATFEIRPKNNGISKETEISFVTLNDATVVLETPSGKNSLVEGAGVKFILSNP
jgi:hypothetical protein